METTEIKIAQLEQLDRLIRELFGLRGDLKEAHKGAIIAYVHGMVTALLPNDY